MKLKYFRVEERDEITYWVFDTPDSAANIFNEESLKELKSLAETQDKNRVTVIISAKKSIFIAGADITMIKKLKGQDEAYKASRFGQETFDQISKLNIIAAIHGACMGGGCELSLACKYRVCSDSNSTKIALPEVNLGILPGWGGTQRLPRIIGFIRSLDYVLTGKNIDASKARKLSLVNDVYPHEIFVDKVHEFALQVKAGKVKPAHANLSAMESVIESNPITRKVPISKARDMVLSKTKGHYPAPLKILDVLDKTFSHGPVSQSGLELEAKYFAELASTDICKNLIDIFLGSEAKKKTKAPNALPMKKGAVLGAGIMGGGIAWAYASASIPNIMKDINNEALNNGLKSAYDSFSKKFSKKFRGSELKRVMDQNMSFIVPQVTYAGFKNVDVIIEAVVEDLNIKRKVMEEAAAASNPNTILASNTSSILISDIQQNLSCKERIVGMHFFNPVPLMPLVEVIAGKDTKPEAVDTIVALTQKMGKVPIVVNDGPGFLVNRLLLPYMNEACFLVQEGIPVEDIDRALLNFGMPMGPCHLLDEVGIDVGSKVSKILEHYFGDRMPACSLNKEFLDRKLYGRKNGKGFYIYEGKDKRLNPEVATFVKQTNKMPESDIIKRCLWPMIAEADRAMRENIVSSAADCDLALVFGIGFPPFRGGLLKYADRIGLKEIEETLNGFAKTHGKRYQCHFDRSSFYGEVAPGGSSTYKSAIHA